jgi:outer membrane lipoprotein SlyB
LTVAGSTLGGAAIGGIAGGKKGAAIGSLVGAGSGAVYTYKIRKRHRHYRRY